MLLLHGCRPRARRAAVWWDARQSLCSPCVPRARERTSGAQPWSLAPRRPHLEPASWGPTSGSATPLLNAVTNLELGVSRPPGPGTVSRAAQQRPYSPSLYLLQLWWRSAPWRRSSLRCVTWLPGAEYRATLLLTPSPPFSRGAQPFIEDVASFLKDKDVETAIRQLQDTYSRLQMQEARSAQTTCAPTRLNSHVCHTTAVPTAAAASETAEQAA